MEALNLHDGTVYLDCTLGGAGHSLEAASRIAPSGTLIGVDQDDMALEAAAQRLRTVPLDSEPSTQTLNAAEIINTYNEADLARVLRDYGDEKWAARIARFVCDERRERPVETTFQLVDLIKRAIPAKARRTGGHPAKRTFQALRVEVNHEMDVLRRGLDAAIRWLNPGGKIAVISYQSLEDKIVKEVFKKMQDPCTCPPDFPVCVCGKKPVLKVETRKPITPSAEEIERNQRAHSARLRVATKLETN